MPDIQLRFHRDMLVLSCPIAPVLAQIDVVEHNPRQRQATPENPYHRPDVMMEAAQHLRAAGAQFLRATGQATPAYAGALVAATDGLDAHRPDVEA